jgi:hypothetical protein
MATVDEMTRFDSIEETPSIDLHQVDFQYEPFPMGWAANVISPGYYEQLIAAWPAEHLFLYKPSLGNKYSLSSINNPELYHAFLAQSEPWMMLYRLVKSEAFIEYVLECLRNHNIDLGVTAAQLNSRFEFSMLSGNGGNIVPHTDAPQKLVTLVIYMVRPGEWNSAFGGGTSALKPKDVRKTYNDLNIQLGFNEVECLYTYPFVSNGCVVFVKTFNSYHAVYPIMGRADLPRKSLTINLELKVEPRLEYIVGNRSRFRLN